MSKKYRLEINYSEITEDNFKIVHLIRENRHNDGYDLKCTEASGELDFGTIVIPVDSIPDSWLTEIKEPLSFEEWFNQWFSSYPERDDMSSISVLKISNNLNDAWNACLENQKLGVVVDGGKDFKIGDVVGRRKNMIVVHRKVYENDNAHLKRLLRDMKAGIDGCSNDEKWGLKFDSEDDEIIPITKKDLCYIYSMGLKFAREGI